MQSYLKNQTPLTTVILFRCLESNNAPSHLRITAIKSKERGQIGFITQSALYVICVQKKFRRGWSEMNKDITVY